MATSKPADVRISFSSLETEVQCLTIQQYVQARGQIGLSRIPSNVDNNGILRYRLTIEYSAEMFSQIEM